MQYGRETKRLAFVEQRDGIKAAIAFAKQGIRGYRSSVLSKKGNMYKDKMIMSYVCFKRYVAKKEISL
ncbi:MAG: hypothetical protein KAJ19_19460 [Gammaproteobacteria bacterium]|nr:hypothetical protein [Gammaproteobacteria bacterium]